MTSGLLQLCLSESSCWCCCWLRDTTLRGKKWTERKGPVPISLQRLMGRKCARWLHRTFQCSRQIFVAATIRHNNNNFQWQLRTQGKGIVSPSILEWLCIQPDFSSGLGKNVWLCETRHYLMTHANTVTPYSVTVYAFNCAFDLMLMKTPNNQQQVDTASMQPPAERAKVW